MVGYSFNYKDVDIQQKGKEYLINMSWHRLRCSHASDLIALEEMYISKEDLSRMIKLYSF